jgi:4-hydroxy-tetrahydrodipicolinate synthase
MANFHPDLYAWLCENYARHPEKAEQMQALLGALSAIQYQQYPVNAKYHMALEGLGVGVGSRARDKANFRAGERMEVEQLHQIYKLLKTQFLSPHILN